MIILAIDFGIKYIGLALADTNLNIAFPYQTLKNNNHFLDELKEVIIKEGVKKVIVGRPIGMEGQITEQTKITDQFVNFLKNNLSIPVEIFDERLSSKMVELTKMGQNKKRGETAEHAAAAAIILQEYLEKSKN